MSFIQPAPVLDNQYRSDRVLRSWVTRNLPATVRDATEGDLDALGAYAAQAWHAARERSPMAPVLVHWDAWGQRVDRIELTPAWQLGPELATRYGLVAAGHDSPHGEHARSDQFARVYLAHVASEFFTCPLAMSDGAATALKAAGNTGLIERALPHLISRKVENLWLSGQWMTETRGGSDVADSETIARQDVEGRWRLYGRKWFTSAVHGDMALTLARPEGAADGAATLALFYLETHDRQGEWNGIRIDRLKDKLGTRELPTAEIHLDGALAEPVVGLDHGVRAITPVLNITRTWNAVCALATMRRCLALCVDFARRRHAFGRPLIDQPLHRATLAALHAEFEAAFHLVFFVTKLLGRTEAGVATDDERDLLRVLTPVAKLWTGKLAVRIASETCEAFGGGGYIEDTGIPLLLRDAQVYPIWEGTTNVLALDTLRAIGKIGFKPTAHAAKSMTAGTEAAAPVATAFSDTGRWLADHANDRDALEAGARGFALTLARGFAAALLAQHVRADRNEDPASTAALRRFITHGLVRLTDDVNDDALLLLGGQD